MRHKIMGTRTIFFLCAVLLAAGVAVPGFAQADIGDIQRAAADFSKDITKALPFNSSLGLNWSDAYIGNFPHFGVGISAGATTTKMASIEKLAGYFDAPISFDMGGKMPIPAYTAEGRIGGFGVPLDIGLKFGILPSTETGSVTLDYLMAGADIRFAVLEGNILLPKLSVGMGVNYLKGGVGGKAGGGDITIPFDFFGRNIISLSRPEVNLTWNTFVLELKAQISKSFAILTPYLGAGGSYAWSNVGYSVDSDVAFNGRPITNADIAIINSFLKLAGLKPVNIDVEGIESVIKDSAFNVKLYGGFSINIIAFSIDFTGLFNVLDQNYGASLGFRFQL